MTSEAVPQRDSGEAPEGDRSRRRRYRVRRRSSGRRLRLSRRTTYALVAAGALAVGVLAWLATPPNVERMMERAQAHRAKGDNAAAMVEIQNVLATKSANPKAFFFAGQALAGLGDWVTAENALRRALEHGHPAEQVLPLLGKVLLDLEKYAEVSKVLGDEVQPGNPTAPDLAVLRGRGFLGLDEFEQAETQFRLAMSLRPSAAAKLGLAHVAMAERDRARADALIDEVLAEDPSHADALLLRAEITRFSGRVDEAAGLLQKALAAHPQNPDVLFALAALEVGRDRLDAAKPLIQRLNKAAPRSPRMRYVAAQVAYRERRLQDARNELKRLSEALPNHPPGLLLIGMVQYADSRYDLAQSAFAAYLKRHPGEPGALRMLGATLLAKGQAHLAVNVLAPYAPTSQDVGILAVAAEAYRQVGHLVQSRGLLQRALALEPNNPDLLRILALGDLAQGERQKAIAALRQAIAQNPPDARADEALIMTLLGDRQIEPAEKAAAALEQRLPKSSHAFTLKAAVHMAKGEFPAARQSLEQALRLDPANLDAVEALANVDAAEGRPDSRRERLEAILKVEPMHAGALLALARLDLALGRHAESVASIRQALATHPQSINALLMLADVQFRLGRADEAVISARQAHDLHPEDTRAIALLGEALMATGEKQAAIETLGKLVNKQPDVVSGYLRLAAAHLAAGDTVNARATAQSALRKDPRDPGARALLADIYIQTGSLNDAAALALKTQKEEPNSALGWRMEGDVHLARKDFPKASEAYRKAASLQVSGSQLVKIHQAAAAAGNVANDNALRSWVNNHPDDVDTRFYLADALNDTGRYGEAAHHYKEVLRRVPNSARALNNLAWALHWSGDKAAIVYAKRAVQLAPGSAAALDTLGWILVEQGNAAEGVPALLKAVSLDSGNPEIRYHLAQSMLKIGDTRRAKTELKALLDSNKPFRQLPEARALAARLGP